MIVKAVGIVNGIYVVFYKNEETGLWDTVVPGSLSGDYVMDITAYDEAGNKAYTTKWLFILNADKTEAMVVPLKYNSETNEWSKYVAYESNSKYKAHVQGEKYMCIESVKEYANESYLSNGGG